MNALERRLVRCEEAHIRQLAAQAGAPYGVSADGLLEEARQFFVLPLAEQLAAMASITPELRCEGFTDADLADMRETLIRYDRPMP
jgi:hypothetical protein